MGRQSINALVEKRQRENDPAFLAALMLVDLGEKIAETLKFARESKGLSQKALADLLNTKQPRISQMEDPAYCNYTLSALTEAAAFLGYEIDVLFRPQRDVSAQAKAEAYALVEPRGSTMIVHEDMNIELYGSSNQGGLDRVVA